MVQMKYPLLKFHKTMKGKVTVEDLQMRPTVFDW